MKLAALALATLLAPSTALAADAPKTLHIAGVLYDGVESAWERAYVDGMRKVQAQHPHGLEISFDYTEHVSPDQAEQVIRDYADTGRYEIIFTDSSYADAIERLHADYPKLLFVFAGAGNHGVGGNAYWVTIHLQESGYLMGMLAGRMTKSGTIGIVGTYPTDDTNDEINGFFAGIRAVNPTAKRKLSFIESWYDPQKSAAATAALVAAGADYVLEVTPAFEACQAAKIGCFGNYADLNGLAPDAVVTSALAQWEPNVNYIIDQWWANATEGKPYDAPKEAVWFPLGKGGTDLAPYHGWDAKLPAAVKDEVAAARQKILSGELKIPLNLANAASD